MPMDDQFLSDVRAAVERADAQEREWLARSALVYPLLGHLSFDTTVQLLEEMDLLPFVPRDDEEEEDGVIDATTTYRIGGAGGADAQ